jgi:hypothetical protein
MINQDTHSKYMFIFEKYNIIIESHHLSLVYTIQYACYVMHVFSTKNS